MTEWQQLKISNLVTVLTVQAPREVIGLMIPVSDEPWFEEKNKHSRLQRSVTSYTITWSACSIIPSWYWLKHNPRRYVCAHKHTARRGHRRKQKDSRNASKALWKRVQGPYWTAWRSPGTWRWGPIPWELPADLKSTAAFVKLLFNSPGPISSCRSYPGDSWTCWKLGPNDLFVAG